MLITATVTWSQPALRDMTLSQWTDGKKKFQAVLNLFLQHFFVLNIFIADTVYQCYSFCSGEYDQLAVMGSALGTFQPLLFELFL